MMDEFYYYNASLRTLCSILEALQGGGGAGENVNLAAVGGVAATYAALGLRPESTVHTSGDVGIFSLGVVNDTGADLATNNNYVGSAHHSTGAAIANIWYTAVPAALRPTSILKLEDAPHASGDAGVMALGVQNSAFATFGADLDYSPLATGRAGNVLSTLVIDDLLPVGRQVAKFEDQVHTSGDPGIPALSVRRDTPTSTCADADYTNPASNNVNALYNEPANQVAAWATATVAGTAGGITTAGASILTNSAKVKLVNYYNSTDVAVQLSLDAGTSWPITIPASGGSGQLDIGTNGRWSASNIHARSLVSNSSSGSLYVGVMI